MSASKVLTSTARISLVAVAGLSCMGDADRSRPKTRGEKDVAAVSPCVLAGHWVAVLERPGYQVRGIIDIKIDSLPPLANPEWRQWHGRYALEWWRLWGPKEGRIMSTSTGAGTDEEIQHGVLALMHGDTVAITLSPLISHGPIGIRGMRQGDTIRGEWRQRSGRLPPPPPDSSNVDRAPHGTALLTRPEAGCAARTT